MIRLEVSKIDSAKLLKLIEKRLQQTMENVSNDLYYNIFDIDHRSSNYHSRYPYLTGSYMASWRIAEGSIDGSITTYKIGGPRPHRPSNVYQYKGPYTPVYISNSIDYASKLENVGSPLHKSPWHVATHAYNITVTSYRVKARI